MLTLVLSIALALPLAPQEKRSAPDESRVAQAVEALEGAFKKGEASERLRALQGIEELPDARVVKAASRGLDDKDRGVRIATFRAFGRLQHPDALTALEKHYRKDRKQILEDDELTVELFREMARHGQPSSIEILSDKPFSSKSFDAIRARIYGLGMIRTPESVEALIDMAQKVRMEDLKTWMPELRVPLYHILGVDQGDSPQLWGQWMREHKKSLEIPERAPDFKDSSQRERWNQFWGIQEGEARRGQD